MCKFYQYIYFAVKFVCERSLIYVSNILIVFRIKKDFFIKAAAEIVLAYPNERASVYFIQAKPKTKHSSRTYNNGKLWNRYHTVQKALGTFTDAQSDSDDAEDALGIFFNTTLCSTHR